MLAASCISWAMSDCRRSGPTVGSVSTTAVMVSPETIAGRSQPTVLTIGFSATRADT